MLTKLLVLLLLSSSCIEIGEGAKILFYNVIATPSHGMILNHIATKLIANGHSVTFISSQKEKQELNGITYFYPKKSSDYWTEIMSGEGDPEMTTRVRRNREDNVFTQIIPVIARVCELLMQSEDFQEWVLTASFDLVIINACHNECGLGLAYKLKAPHMFVQTASFAPWHADLFGMPLESSWIPDFRLNFTQDMDFYHRLYNTLYTLKKYVYIMGWHHYRNMEDSLRRGLKDPSMPSIATMAKDTRLVLVNSYFAAEYGRSLPPLVVTIGGLHCGLTNESLPNLFLNIEEFVNKFPDGFVYISFGTVSRPSPDMEANLLEVLSTKFSNFGFVFKWTGELPQNPPRNVLPISWAPQQTILAHPKIQAFLTHAGMLSIQEAAYYGVPAIVFPVRAEQDYNAECLVRLGVAVRLEVVDLTINQLENAIHTILYDKSYKEKMEKLSQVYRDRPEHPLTTAVWWTEFVIRNEAKGNDLRNMLSLGIHQNWIQRRLLDVWAFIFFVLVVSILVIAKILIILKNFIVNRITSSKTERRDKQKTL